jgi:hypothetical protein
LFHAAGIIYEKGAHPGVPFFVSRGNRGWAFSMRKLIPTILLSSLAFIASPAWAAHYDIFVYSTPIAGEEQAFIKGQDARIKDALKLPGFRTAKRFEAKAIENPATLLGNYFTLYGVEADNADVASDALAKLGPAPSELSEIVSIYSPIGAVKHVPADVPNGTVTPLPAPGKTKLIHYYLFAHLNAGATPDQEKIFNDTYDNLHFPDVLRNPGFLWGEREKLVANKTPGRGAQGYLAMYEFQTYDLGVSIAEVRRRLKVGLTHPFPKGSTVAPSMTLYALPVTDARP